MIEPTEMSNNALEMVAKPKNGDELFKEMLRILQKSKVN